MTVCLAGKWETVNNANEPRHKTSIRGDNNG
jgi:hypothetical protein